MPDTNRAVQQQEIARDLKFPIKAVEELYYLCSENEGADQLCGYREADLRLCFRIYAKSRFSHNKAHIFPSSANVYLCRYRRRSEQVGENA